MSSAKSTGPKFRCARTKEILVLYFFIGRKPVSEPEHSGGEHHCGATSQEKAKPKASPSKKRATPKSEAPAPTTIHLYHQNWEEQVMRVSICIGSACHLRGSREIIQKLQTLVKANNVSDKVDLNGAFCSGNCVNGVCVTIDGELFSLSPETTEEFFNKEIMGRL